MLTDDHFDRVECVSGVDSPLLGVTVWLPWSVPIKLRTRVAINSLCWMLLMTWRQDGQLEGENASATYVADGSLVFQCICWEDDMGELYGIISHIKQSNKLNIPRGNVYWATVPRQLPSPQVQRNKNTTDNKRPQYNRHTEEQWGCRSKLPCHDIRKGFKLTITCLDQLIWLVFEICVVDYLFGVIQRLILPLFLSSGGRSDLFLHNVQSAVPLCVLVCYCHCVISGWRGEVSCKGTKVCSSETALPYLKK